jgi:signal transduction histidine kinase
MNLTYQFVAISLLPASFLALLIYWLKTKRNHPQLFAAWILVLLTAAVWASGVLSHYLGANISPAVTYSWRLASNHALSFFSLSLLWATAVCLALPSAQIKRMVAFAALLWLASLGLDQAIWRYTIPTFSLMGRPVNHFELWAIVWVMSSLLPLGWAWLVTERTARRLPPCYYRNQIEYWLLVLSLVILGSLIGLTRQLLSQQTAVFLVLGAMVAGTYAFSQPQLPDVQATARQLSSRFLGAVVIVGLSWLAFWLIARGLPDLPEAKRDVNLAVIAAVFSLFFLLVYHLVSRFSRGALLSTTMQSEILAGYGALAGTPLQLSDAGQLAAKLTQLHLGTDDSRLWLAQDGSGGSLILRPLNERGATGLVPVVFAADSPFSRHLRQGGKALSHYDLEHWVTFATLDEGEKAALNEWGRLLYMPLHTGSRLIGLLGLGGKFSGEPYGRHDLTLLQELALPLALLLAQAQNVTALQQIGDHTWEQNRNLAYETRRLQQLATLYHTFLCLVSPDLRQPFTMIERDLQRVHDLIPENRRAVLENLNQQCARVKEMINNLVNMAARVQQQGEFHFQLTRLDEIARETQQSLVPLAEARRVRVEIKVKNGTAPLVYGDEQRLREAVYYLLHNAIKFNKIGGLVRLECGLMAGEAYLRVMDNGVGISAERLPSIWEGFAALNQVNVYNPKGAGMGLLLTRFIIQAHGGRVESSSQHGRGSVFSFYLPLMLED